MSPQAQVKEEEDAVARVHTADDERASWVTLLSALQLKEYSSRQWDAQKRLESALGKFVSPPEYGITVGLQKKTRSWDFIPSSINKPYATSTICHLVEMMAMLGLYWKVFDQSFWNLRAEGNGFILTSTTVHGLGVMVVFAITGSSTFKENRVYVPFPLLFSTSPWSRALKTSSSGKLIEVSVWLEDSRFSRNSL